MREIYEIFQIRIKTKDFNYYETTQRDKNENKLNEMRKAIDHRKIKFNKEN